MQIFMDHLYTLALYAMLLSAWYGAGAGIISLFDSKRKDCFGERVVIGLSLGCVISGFAISLFGSFGIDLRLLQTLTMLFCMLGFYMLFLDWRSGCFNEYRLLKQRLNFFSLFCVFFLVVLFIICFAPPTAGDVLNYQLDIPKRWLENGRISFLEDHRYCGLPSLMNANFLIGLIFDSFSLPALMSWTSMILSVSAVWLIAQKQYGALTAKWAFIIFLFSPMIVLVSTSAFVDIFLVNFCAVAWLCIIIGEKEKKVSAYILAGVFLGAAAATKTNALIFLPVFGWLLFSDNNPLRMQWIKPVLYVFIPALLVLLPMYYRTWLWTGNPFYPALPDVLKNLFPEIRGVATVAEKSVVPSLRNIILLPFIVSLNPSGLTSSSTVVYNMMSFMPVAVIVPALLCVKGYCRKFWKVIAGGLFFYLITFLLGGGHQRFYWVASPFFAIAAGGGIVACSDKKLLTTFITYSLGINILMTVFFGGIMLRNCINVVFGVESYDSFLMRTTRHYDVFCWLNRQHLQPGKIASCLGGTFYLDKPKLLVSYICSFRDTQYQSLNAWSRDLSKFGVKYVILSENEQKNIRNVKFPLGCFLRTHGKLIKKFNNSPAGGRFRNLTKSNTQVVLIYEVVNR